MSSLPGANLPSSVPGIPSTSGVTRSNPDRKRREQPFQHPHDKKEDGATPHGREEDVAELSHHEEASPGAAPVHQDAVKPVDGHPHIDIQA